MFGHYVRPVRCTYSREQAVLAYWLALEQLGQEPTVDLCTVLVAHGALECGNFSAGLWNNNPGNIKAAENWPGEYTCITVNEILDGRERWFSPEGELTGRGGTLLRGPLPVPPGDPQTRMRAFRSLEAGIADKIRFLLAPNWAPCLDAARRGDASAYVRAIRARRYFTAYAGKPDPTPYETSVVKLAGTYRPLVEKVGAGGAHELDLSPSSSVPVADGSAARLNPLDAEQLAQLEQMQALWFDEQMRNS